jgi:hypothetical protein
MTPFAPPAGGTPGSARGADHGFGPLQVLRHWVGRPEDPDAGGIAADAVEQGAPNAGALVELANPPFDSRVRAHRARHGAGTPPPEPPPRSAAPRGGPWDHGPRDVEIHLSGYDFLTSGPVRYLPVTRRGALLGYLWASTTDHAADYLPRAAAGADGFNAGMLWMSRLDQSQVEGLAPLAALRRWVGKPEDPVAGGIPALVLEQEALSTAVLRELASAGDEDAVASDMDC